VQVISTNIKTKDDSTFLSPTNEILEDEKQEPAKKA